MATWNRKQRSEMGDLQRKKGAPKRRVLCLKCHKAHDAPVCASRHAAFIAEGRAAMADFKKLDLERKVAARQKQGPVNIAKQQRRERRRAKA